MRIIVSFLPAAIRLHVRFAQSKTCTYTNTHLTHSWADNFISSLCNISYLRFTLDFM